MLATDERGHVMRHKTHSEFSAGHDFLVSFANVRRDRAANNVPISKLRALLMRNSLQLDFVRSAFAYSAFAAAFLFADDGGGVRTDHAARSNCFPARSKNTRRNRRYRAQFAPKAAWLPLRSSLPIRPSFALLPALGGWADGWFLVDVLLRRRGGAAVDGALGMAFGVTATTVMLSFGTSPAQASAMVHIAEIFTTAASGRRTGGTATSTGRWSAHRHPGRIGGILGATVLANVDGKISRHS